MDDTQIVLNPDDPFESALISMVQTARRKRADYARDGSPFSNFETTSEMLGIPGWTRIDSAFFNVLQKIARLKALRANGRMDDPQNESVIDTYLDLAVYAVLTYAMARISQEPEQSEGDVR
jgi:hypothetical protein